jgi:hypothetical protein
MPTKENFGGEQQPYDPNSGEYGNGSGQPSSSLKITETNKPYGKSFSIDFGNEAKVSFADKAKVDAVVEDWKKSAPLGKKAKVILEKAINGEEITENDIKILSEAYANLGSRVYIVGLHNSGNYRNYLSMYGVTEHNLDNRFWKWFLCRGNRLFEKRQTLTVVLDFPTFF